LFQESCRAPFQQLSSTINISVPKIFISGTINFIISSFLTVGSSSKWSSFTIKFYWSLGGGRMIGQHLCFMVVCYGTTNFFIK
jgi:hypothetical protein